MQKVYLDKNGQPWHCREHFNKRRRLEVNIKPDAEVNKAKAISYLEHSIKLQDSNIRLKNRLLRLTSPAKIKGVVGTIKHQEAEVIRLRNLYLELIARRPGEK